MARQRNALVVLDDAPTRDAVVARLVADGLHVRTEARSLAELEDEALDVLGCGVRAPAPGPFVGCDPGAWYDDVHDALTRPFRLVRAAVPTLRRAGGAGLHDRGEGGRLVVVGAGWRASGRADGTAAGAVHGGVVALVKTLARDLGPDGISVNQVVVDPHDPPAPQAVAEAVSYLAGPIGGAMVGQLLSVGRGGELRP